MKTFLDSVQHGKYVTMTTKVTVGDQRIAGRINLPQPRRMKT
jgi:hypothetical protein